MKIFQAKTPEQVKNEKIAMLKSRIMNFKSSHPMTDAEGNPVSYDELAALEALLASATE